MGGMLDTIVGLVGQGDAEAGSQNLLSSLVDASSEKPAVAATPSLGDQLLEYGQKFDGGGVASGMTAMSQAAYERVRDQSGVDAAVKAREQAVSAEDAARRSSWAYGE